MENIEGETTKKSTKKEVVVNLTVAILTLVLCGLSVVDGFAFGAALCGISGGGWFVIFLQSYSDL